MKTQPKPLPTIQSILDEHITLTVECLDRLYLNGYVPGLQTEAGLIGFLTRHLQFPVVHFKKGERKDKIAGRMRRQHPVRDGAQFGEGFNKICTYAPYPIKVCLHGHEWAKRQLQHQGIGCGRRHQRFQEL